MRLRLVHGGQSALKDEEKAAAPPRLAVRRLAAAIATRDTVLDAFEYDAAYYDAVADDLERSNHPKWAKCVALAERFLPVLDAPESSQACIRAVQRRW